MTATAVEVRVVATQDGVVRMLVGEQLVEFTIEPTEAKGPAEPGEERPPPSASPEPDPPPILTSPDSDPYDPSTDPFLTFTVRPSVSQAGLVIAELVDLDLTSLGLIDKSGVEGIATALARLPWSETGKLHAAFTDESMATAFGRRLRNLGGGRAPEIDEGQSIIAAAIRSTGGGWKL